MTLRLLEDFERTNWRDIISFCTVNFYISASQAPTLIWDVYSFHLNAQAAPKAVLEDKSRYLEVTYINKKTFLIWAPVRIIEFNKASSVFLKRTKKIIFFSSSPTITQLSERQRLLRQLE